VKLGEFVVIEPGAAQFAVVEFEAEWPDQMQGHAGVRAKAYYISRVGRDLGFEQYQVKH
jgi:hypothetical protein